MNVEPEGYLFDWDGTLNDSLKGAYRGVKNVCRMTDIRPPTFLQFLRTFSAPYLECWRRLGVTASEADIYRWYKQAAGHMTALMFPDVDEVLTHLTETHRAPVGIVTAQNEGLVDTLCERAGIRGKVSYLAGGAEDKVEAIKNFCHSYGLDRRRVWFVGDFSSDMRDGRLAGVRCLGITRGNMIGDLLIAAGAEHCIGELRELPDVVCCRDRS